jgi:ankyrin repeat protein
MERPLKRPAAAETSETEKLEKEKKARTERQLFLPRISEEQTQANRALLESAAFGNVQGVQQAVTLGADSDVVDDGGESALGFAILNNHPAVVEALRQAGATLDFIYPNIPEGETAANRQLLLGAVWGNLDSVREALGRGADVDVQDSVNRSAVSWAAFYGRLDVVRALIEAGADIREHDINYYDPLGGAAMHGFLEVVRELLSRNADQDLINNVTNETPLSMAAGNNHLPVVRELLWMGAYYSNADPDNMRLASARAFEGHPLILAVIRGNLNDVQSLITSQTKTSEIQEALIYAIAQSHGYVGEEYRSRERIVEYLISLFVREGRVDILLGEPLAHVNRLLSREPHNPGFKRSRAMLAATVESPLVQVRQEYLSNPVERRIYVQGMLERLVTQPELSPRERANYDSIRSLLRSKERAETVLNNALRLSRTLLSNPKITMRERNDYQNLERFLEPSLPYQVFIQAINEIENILQKSKVGPELENYRRLVALLRQYEIRSFEEIRNDLLKVIHERLEDPTLGSNDRQNYERLLRMFRQPVYGSYLAGLPFEVFMQIVGRTLSS